MTVTEISAEDYRKQGAEKVWQKRIVHVAKLYGWRTYHTLYSPGSDKGYPDLTCVHRNVAKTLYIEVKGPKPTVHPEQIAWLADINSQPDTRLGIVAFPEDLDAVSELLAGREVDTFEDDRWPVLRVRLIKEL